MNTLMTQNMTAIDPRMVEIINNMQVGFNVVPGMGVGYASNEEDLEKMKQFVYGAAVAMQMRAQAAAQVETSEEEVDDQGYCEEEEEVFDPEMEDEIDIEL